MTRRQERHNHAAYAFTLIELLVVMSIISLLISILLPSLSRARDQAKGVHCVAKLKEFGMAIAAYENTSEGALPPAKWWPSPEDLDPKPLDGRYGTDDTRVAYGWTELLYTYVYAEPIRVPTNYPVQRHVEGQRWGDYFLCRAAGETETSSGHYRVYLPSWSAGTYSLEEEGIYGDTTRANPYHGAHREQIRPKMPLLGDANTRSERGDGVSCDECSYIDAGEANFAGSDGRSNGNRFSDRHYGGTNFLFQDLHAGWSSNLREELARDYDLNSVIDIEVQP